MRPLCTVSPQSEPPSWLAMTQPCIASVLGLDIEAMGKAAENLCRGSACFSTVEAGEATISSRAFWPTAVVIDTAGVRLRPDV
jgi:hypothetical protein